MAAKLITRLTNKEEEVATLNCGRCEEELRPNAKFCDICGTPVFRQPPASVFHSQDSQNSIKLSTRLWDQYEEVSQKHREGKRTAREMAIFFEKRAEIEEVYGNSLIKLARLYPIMEQKTFQDSWLAFKDEQLKLGQLHIGFSNHVMSQTHKHLAQMYQELKSDHQTLEDKHEAVLQNMNRHKGLLNKANERVQVAQSKVNIAQSKAVPGASQNTKVQDRLRQANLELEQIENERLEIQTRVFTSQNRYNQAVAKILETFEIGELKRLEKLREILKAACRTSSKRIHDASQQVIATWEVACRLDPMEDTNSFVSGIETGNVCPWAAETRPAELSKQASRREASRQEMSAQTLQKSEGLREPTIEEKEPELTPTPISRPKRLSIKKSEIEGKIDAGANTGEVNTALVKEFEFDPWIPPSLYIPVLSCWELDHDQWRLAALENILLSTNLLQDLPSETTAVVEEVIRVQLEIGSSKYKVALDCLRKCRPDRKKGAESLVFLDFRLDLLRNVELSNSDERDYWLKRQLSVILCSLVWHIHSADQASWVINNAPVTPEKLVQTIHEICLKIKQGFEESGTAGASVDKLHGQFVDVMEVLDPQATELHYPDVVISNMYQLLLQTCMDDFSMGDDEQADPARLHTEWRAIIAALNPFATRFDISSRFAKICLLRVLFDIVRDYEKDDWSGLDVINGFADVGKTEFADQDQTSEILKHMEQLFKDLIRLDTHSNGSSDISIFDIMFQRRTMEWIQHNMELWLSDYHRADCENVKRVVQIYTNVLRLKFGSNVPENDTVAVRDKNVASLVKKSVEKNYSRLRGSFAAEMSEEDWSEFGHLLCEDIEVDATQYCPAISVAHTTSIAEFSVSTFAELFAKEVNDTLNKHAETDDFFLTIVRITRSVMVTLSRYAQELAPGNNPYSDEQIETGLNILETVFPNLEDICSMRLIKWIQDQKEQVDGWLTRCLQLDEWKAIDDETPFSSSVVDIFSLLQSLVTGYFTFLEQFHPNGQSTSKLFFSLVNEIIETYATAINRQSGSIDDVRPVQELVPKFVKKKKLFRRKKKKSMDLDSHQGQTTKVYYMKGQDRQEPVSDGTIGHGNLAAQTFEALCVRLCCLNVAKDKIDELSRVITLKWKGIQELRTSDPNGTADIVLTQNIDIPTKYNIVLRIAAKKIAAMNYKVDGKVLYSARKCITNAFERLVSLLSARVVYIELKESLLDNLYVPSVVQCRVKDGRVIQDLDEVMGPLFKRVDEYIFPQVVKGVYIAFIQAFEWVLLSGGDYRVFIPEDYTVIKEDIRAVRDLFATELDDKIVVSLCEGLDLVIDLMEEETPRLIDFYNEQCGNHPLDLDSQIISALSRILKTPSGVTTAKLVKILMHRKDKNAVKFVKKVLNT